MEKWATLSSMFIDSHAHLTSDPVYADVEAILKRAKERQISAVINICVDLTSLERGLKLKETEKWIYNVGATPPHTIQEEGERNFPLFEKAAREKQLVAIGEVGLDYYYQHAPKEVQKAFLVRYFHLAAQCLLPVVLHCREAFDDLYAIAEEVFPKSQAVLHCFTGTLQEAEKALERGWMLSFSGIVTFKRSDSLRAVLKQVPLRAILIETDTPYLAPESKRGKRNEPSFIGEIAQTIADIKGLSLEEVAQQTTRNAVRFFNLDGHEPMFAC